MSACIPTDRLMQTLRTQLPGITDPMLNLAIFNVVDEFFRRTSAWMDGQDIELIEDHTEYPYALPTGSTLVRMMAVTHNSVPVPASSAYGLNQKGVGRLAPELTFADGDAAFAPILSDATPDGLFTYSIYAPDYIAINAAPDEEARKFPLHIIMALSVHRDCLECDCGDWGVPEWAWDMFFQVWLDGVLANMFTMPSKPWSNKVQAAYHHKRFRNRMAYHKQEATKSYVYGAPGWRFPRGGWT